MKQVRLDCLGGIRRVLLLGSVASMLFGLAAPAAAQLSRVGGSTLAFAPGGTMRGTDTAYDPAHDVYLQVAGNGPIYGIFVNSAGIPITGAFTIMDGTLGWGHFPRVEYSPHANNGVGGQGGFLVTWHHNIGAVNYLFGRLVAIEAPGALASGIQQLSDGEQGGTWWETGAAMAYSPTSRRFLVAWRTIAYGIRGRFVDTNGTPFGGVMQLENPGGSRDPALAWNPATDEFGLVSSGWNSTSALASFRRIRAADGAVSGRVTFGFSAGTFATAIDVNSGYQYVLTWALHPGTMSAVFDYAGNQLATNFITGRIGHDQSLAMAYNSSSGTFLAAGSDGSSLEIAAVEITGSGGPNSTAQPITDGARSGSFYPMVAQRYGTNQWDIVYSRDFRGPTAQIIATSSTDGGRVVGPAPPPPPPPSGCTTADPFASIGGGTCVNGGWSPGGSGGGSTGGCATPQPASGWTCVNGGWLPPAGGGTGGSGGCTTADPFASIGGGTCVNGGWSPGGSAGRSTGGCATPQPASGWTCVNGGWLPPAGGGTGGSGGCTTPDPFASIGGGTCVNGGWTPGGSGGGSGNSCTTVQPAAGWTCVNGGWLPPTSGGVGCTTPDPFSSLGGGVCSNGGWRPK